jgi:hypothetical protein
LNSVVDLFFKLAFVDESVYLQGAEKMTDAFAHSARRNFLSESKGGAKGPQLAPLRTQHRMSTMDARL